MKFPIWKYDGARSVLASPEPALDTRAVREGRLYRAVFAAVFIAGGAAVGYGVSEIVTPAPSECAAMATTADEIFGLWDDLAIAVNDRGDALDKETYAIHDAEVRHLDASLDAVEVEYIDAKYACLGEEGS